MIDRHVLTPAAVSDDVHLPLDPVSREKRLLFTLAITASLPRVLWGLTYDAMGFIEDSAAVWPMFTALRVIAVALDVVCIVIVGQLALLDQRAPDARSKRVAFIAASIVELVLSFIPLWGMLYGILSGLFAVMLNMLPAFIAAVLFARWLSTFLKQANQAPMLVVVVV